MINRSFFNFVGGFLSIILVSFAFILIVSLFVEEDDSIQEAQALEALE